MTEGVCRTAPPTLGMIKYLGVEVQHGGANLGQRQGCQQGEGEGMSSMGLSPLGINDESQMK